jgi:hypothetical protein
MVMLLEELVGRTDTVYTATRIRLHLRNDESSQFGY